MLSIAARRKPNHARPRKSPECHGGRGVGPKLGGLGGRNMRHADGKAHQNYSLFLYPCEPGGRTAYRTRPTKIERRLRRQKQL